MIKLFAILTIIQIALIVLRLTSFISIGYGWVMLITIVPLFLLFLLFIVAIAVTIRRKGRRRSRFNQNF